MPARGSARGAAPRAGIVDRVLRRVGLQRVSAGPARGGASTRAMYAAAQMNRTTADWAFAPLVSAKKEMEGELAIVRGRSREQARNNGVVKRWLRLCETNIVGPDGIRLQAQVKRPDGTLDTATNAEIEARFREWSKKGTASIDGRRSLHAIARAAVKSKKRDGCGLVRLIRGAPNRFAFALQLLDADQLDHTLNRPRQGALNEIRQGIEVDRYLRPVAYWLYDGHPSDGWGPPVRVPADEILHLARLDRAGQVRGMPESHAVIADLHMRAGYQEAELVAARTAASKMGFFKDAEGTPARDPNRKGAADDDEDLEMDAEPGLLTDIGDRDFVPWDPQHPVAAYPTFTKAIDRSASLGLDVSYHTLFGDLEAVNFSSGRLGRQADIDEWRLEQDDLIEDFYDPVYREFVKLASLAGALVLPTRDVSRYLEASWQPRGWESVNPLQDMQAAALRLAMGLTTFRDLCAERGVDFAENVRTLAEEYQLARDADVPLSIGNAGVPAGSGDAEDDDAASGTRPTSAPNADRSARVVDVAAARRTRTA